MLMACRATVIAMMIPVVVLCAARPVLAIEPDCRAPLTPWTEITLYLGRDIGTGGIVSEGAFRRFLTEVVTPRFPDGLTVLDAVGQFRSASGAIIREPSKLLVILAPDANAITARIGNIIEAYKRWFNQESVLQTEHQTCLAFR